LFGLCTIAVFAPIMPLVLAPNGRGNPTKIGISGTFDLHSGLIHRSFDPANVREKPLQRSVFLMKLTPCHGES
jgi:hypothetical protein